MPTARAVVCNCNGISANGTYTIEGPFLVLTTTFGTHRVLLGVQEPRKLAAKLMRNVCMAAMKPTIAAAE